MSHRRALRSLFLPFFVAAAACTPPADASSASDEELRARPGYVIDSIHPMPEMLHRFRAELVEPAALRSGSESQEALVRRFMDALVAQDSLALARMHIDRPEFAWLYFPASIFHAPPYELPPELHWYQLTAESNKGITGALALFRDARDVRYESHACAEERRGLSKVALWSGCEVSWRTAGGPERYRLFGSILEHDGRFKFVSYANRL